MSSLLIKLTALAVTGPLLPPQLSCDGIQHNGKHGKNNAR